MTDLSRDYLNSAYIQGGNDYYPRWQSDAATFRAAMGSRAMLDLPYGPLPRNQFDLFLPDTAPKGLQVFVHGGYWLACGREDYSHLAAGAVARGWACAMPSYVLAPEGRITQMVQQITNAVAAAASYVSGPMVVTGHSAGGHLSARMGCNDRVGIVADRVKRVVPISPIADLAPMMQTDMQETLQISPEEAAKESPAHYKLRAGCEGHVWVGGQERPAFLWQARTLAEAWSCPWTVDRDRHHFDVIDGLSDATSPLMHACLGGF